jgi:hypothetical protein
VTPTEDATDDDTTEAAGTPDQAPPTPVLEGSFAIHTPPDGTLLLVWRRRGTQEDRYLPVPAIVLQMAAQASGGKPDDILQKLAAGAF